MAQRKRTAFSAVQETQGDTGLIPGSGRHIGKQGLTFCLSFIKWIVHTFLFFAQFLFFQQIFI